MLVFMSLLDLLNWWEEGLGILGVVLNNLIKRFASNSYSQVSPLLCHSIIEL